MADPNCSNIIKDYPIANGLDAFRASFSSICEARHVPRGPDALERLGQEDLQNIVLDLLSTLQIHPAARLLRSTGDGKTLFGDLLQLNSAVNSGEFDFDRIKPLVKSALADIPDDILIWIHVYRAVTESTPPPRPISSSIQQTPWSQNTSGFVNSSEFRQNVDPILKLELERLYVGLPKCIEGDNPLFKEGWSGWPAGARENDPRTPLQGSTGKRSLDIGFVNSDITYKPDSEDSRYRLGVRPTWGIASEQFDINKKDGGLQFVTAILGFLRMNDEVLGFDPTIVMSNGERYIEIERDGQTARLIIDKTVRVHGADDDVQNNVRKGLDITKATNYRPGRAMLPAASASIVSRKQLKRRRREATVQRN
ncbi:uncharacterized protein HRG_12023 [Hirsutella rhossiliensis]|uniref:Fungal-type protein kinase domain-containing protein n=1 Tax=Hirsutella rhossiliensis TaxID=111463 RepID=A0A9P8SBV5_9HYPO|nr:uncharacterized protein HRG_12023 [Hirsutella rhossiliensis]KAH0956911.1 hypothetical protein HRG_12023 [Hirsutella rhossiliensis]